MSTLKYNLQSMSGLESITDGISILEDGVLNCIGVVAEDIQTDNLNVNKNITAGQSVAIGKDIAIGNSVVCPNLYATKLVSNSLECKKIKVEKIHLYNNLVSYDDTNVGYIKTTSIIPSFPLLTTNTLSSIVSLPLPIGVYSVCYCFTISLSATSLPSLHSLSHGLSTDSINLNVIQSKIYQNIVFNDLLTYTTLHESGFYHVTDYNTSLSLLVKHHTAINASSSVVIESSKIKVLRIA